jgi:branched-chain amino acid transport system substrate-binding protein
MDGIKRTSSVVLSPTVSTDSMNGKEDAFFRLMPAASKQGELLARRALGRGAMRAAVLIDTKNADYTRAVADGFRRVYRAGGGTVVYDGEFDSSTVDHAQIVSKMNATSPQIAVLSASSIDTAMIAQRASAAGVKIPFIAAMWANTDNLIQLGGKTVEGVELVDMDPQQRSERLDAFTRGYEQQFGESPLMGAVLTSDAIDVVVSALQRIDGGLSPLTFSRALSGQKSYGGLYGQISFDRFGDVSRPLYLSVIENAKKKTIPCEEKGAC